MLQSYRKRKMGGESERNREQYLRLCILCLAFPQEGQMKELSTDTNCRG